MNHEQFNAWLSDYSLRFPQTGSWLTELRDATGTLKTWAEVLAPFELEHALSVNRAMQSGEVMPVRAFDREKTPQIVASEIERLNVNAEFSVRSVPTDDTGNPLICELCNNTGGVLCYSKHPSLPGRKSRYTCLVACGCPLGDRYRRVVVRSKQKPLKLRELPTYDPQYFERVAG